MRQNRTGKPFKLLGKQRGFAGWVSAGLGVLNATGVIGGGNNQSSASQAADPFASQRPQYQQQLQQLMNGNFTPSDPSYQFRMNQGMTNTQRTAAAGGMLNSGNTLAALNDYAQNTASTEYANQFSRLSQLSGANVGSPAAAAQIQQSNAAGGSAAMQQLGGLLGGSLQNWWNTPSGGSAGGVDAPGTTSDANAWASAAGGFT